ncbi:MarR family winged helix-turn-helix transcriptional regulator [Frigoriflavimonas asaccharolytica]|uniref:DNA-binding MarR family transcriptional regulator n=1 Tax=Frigoriflavimonas asaccharolytica TaxID=2735899 RepID=A0A8J8G6F9_9FLAO|nr:winged helix DNA-binding protein [Frigoriflavimonas asaccharolytica]NRS91881.1 DNA-binding MarR family transcriptional regulator [Frigoriflavimonas asaccharolytica]
MEIDLAIDVLNEVKAFQSKNHKSNLSIEDFRNFLNEKAYEKETPKRLTDKYNIVANDVENEIAKQTILLNRYAKLLMKKALHDFPDLVNEDFTYLFRLMDFDSLTKTQLVEKNGHEKQTGIEIIKRLVKNNLIEEFPDLEDKRSVRISVTAKGKAIFAESMDKITLASKIICGDFDIKEKETFLNLLKKLNLFHHTLYSTMRNENIHELEKMV